MAKKNRSRITVDIYIKFVLGIIILAIITVGSVILFKRLPPIPKLVLLAFDFIIYHHIIKYLKTNLKPHKSHENHQ